MEAREMEPNYVNSRIGEKIKDLRNKNGLTQQELAEKLGVSTNTIHLWETKVCKPSMGSLLLLSDLLEISLLDIISKAKKDY